MEESNLPCVNCRQPVPMGGGEAYLQVFVCSNCHRTAQVVSRRMGEAIRRLDKIKEELIRNMLVQGRLQLSDVPERSSREFFDMLAEEARRHEQASGVQKWKTKTPTTIPSKGTMRLPASTADGRPSSD